MNLTSLKEEQQPGNIKPYIKKPRQAKDMKIKNSDINLT